MCDRYSCGSSSASAAAPEVSLENRRAFLKGLISLPLAAVLADPILARAAGERLTEVFVKTPDGRQAGGFLAIPDRTPAPTVLLIHEWWGLNDQIKAVAQDLRERGYAALAVDLYGKPAATTREDAMEFMTHMDPREATESLATWVEWLHGHEAGNGKVGVVGWCFGGGWALNTALNAPVDATVIYYGRVNKIADELAPLDSPVLGHFATRDESITQDMVRGFEQAMLQAGKTDLTIHWYEADHAFANPTGARYDEEDAKLAWERTLAFFEQHLS